MTPQHNTRDDALNVLKNSDQHDRSTLLKALYNIRYNTGDGDEVILLPLLDHMDDGVVASTLFTLWNSYDLRQKILPLVKILALGDARDRMEMPIQSMAISLLGEVALTDPQAYDQLVTIAEDASTSECPRKRAWQSLADIHNVKWDAEYAEEMIMSPESNNSERIRELIREEIIKHRLFPK